MRHGSAFPSAPGLAPTPPLRRNLTLALLACALSLAPQPSGAQSGPRLPLADVPLPPGRPMDLGPDTDDVEEEGPAAGVIAPRGPGASAPAPATAGAPVAAGALPALCADLVSRQTILASRAPPVPVQEGCGLPAPVRLEAVRLADGNLATLSPPAILRCEMAAAVAEWVREDLGPAAAALGSRIETVRVADSYQCRPRNRRKGAKISEHGQGNAFDTYGFVLSDQRALTVKGGQMPMEFQTAMKASACTRFTTVLGLGSDGYHEDHIHVDLAERRLGIRLCKWNLKAPAPAQVARAAPGTPAQARDAAADAAPDAVEADDVPLPPRRPAEIGRR